MAPPRRIAMLCLHGCPLATPGQGPSGGAQVYVRELSLALGRLGHRLDVFTLEHDSHPAGVQDVAHNVRVVHLRSEVTSLASPLSVAYDKTSLLRFAQEAGVSYDLVHSHYWISAQAGIEVARTWEVPHVVMFHTLGRVKMQAGAGPETEERLAAEQAAVAASQAIVAATPEEKRLLAQLYDAQPEKATVVPLGLNTELFRPLDKGQARRKLKLPEGKVVLFAGRPDPIKRLDLGLRAVAHLIHRRKMKDVTFVIVGGSPADAQVASLRRLARELRILGRVRFRRACPRQTMPVYYSASDVLLMTSRYESFSLATAEALACGTPVVAARAGGLKTLVKHGKNGLTVSSSRPVDFARALEKVLGDRATHQRLSSAAPDSVAGLSWESVAGRVAALYRRITRPQPLGLPGRDP